MYFLFPSSFLIKITLFPRCIINFVPLLLLFLYTSLYKQDIRMIKFTLTEDYIELIRLLKITRIAESGGIAKIFVENGEVKRNGVTEQRKRAKIRKGEIIEVRGEIIQVTGE